MYKFGFIGAGNMGGAIAKAVCQKIGADKVIIADAISEKAMELAIAGMLPHNTLGRQALKMLKVYADANHNHEAQSPVAWTGEI